MASSTVARAANVELVQRDDVAKVRAVAEIVLTPRRLLLPERVPVVTETVVVHPAERLCRDLPVADVHAAASQDVHLFGIRLVRLDVVVHEHRLRKMKTGPGPTEVGGTGRSSSSLRSRSSARKEAVANVVAIRFVEDMCP